MLNFWKPLLQFELFRQASGQRPHIIRCAAFALALLCLLQAQFQFVRVSGGALIGSGLGILSGLAWLNYVLTLIAGVGLFAPSLTNERETGTLPLLVIADVPLGPFVLGKWMQDLLPAALIVFVELPLIVSSVFFGGVTLRQAIATTQVLCGLLFLVSAFGVLISVLALSSRRAAIYTLIIVGTVEFGSLMANQLNRWELAGLLRLGLLGEALSFVGSSVGSLSAFVAISRVLASSDFLSVWPVFGLQLFLGVFCLTAAVLCAPLLRREFRSVEDRHNATRRESMRVHGDAIAWREFRFRVFGWNGLGVRLALYGGVAVVVWGVLVACGTPPSSVWTGLLFALILLAVTDLVALAAQLFGTEMRQRTLSTLALTTNRPGQLYSRKLLGLTPAILLAGGVFLAAELMRPATTAYWFEDSWAGMAFVSVSLVVWLTLVVLFSLDFPLASIFVASIALVVCWLFAAMAANCWLAIVARYSGNQGMLAAMTYFMGLVGLLSYAVCVSRVGRAAAR